MVLPLQAGMKLRVPFIAASPAAPLDLDMRGEHKRCNCNTPNTHISIFKLLN